MIAISSQTYILFTFYESCVFYTLLYIRLYYKTMLDVDMHLLPYAVFHSSVQ